MLLTNLWNGSLDYLSSLYGMLGNIFTSTTDVGVRKETMANIQFKWVAFHTAIICDFPEILDSMVSGMSTPSVKKSKEHGIEV